MAENTERPPPFSRGELVPAGASSDARPGAVFAGDARIGGDAVVGDKIVLLPPDRPAPPAQLPADIPGFTGRQDFLHRLDELSSPGAPRTALLTAIHGMAGIGKTALAVHWAHRVAGEFRDGQLYVDLRGYSDDELMPPIEALGRFLRGLGVPNQRIPEDVDERAALYRSILAGRRVLVILDNAASVQQVRPLLPGSATCLTLITSRSQLPALVAQSGAAMLSLDVLSPAESIELIKAIVGPEHAAAEPDAVTELAQRCVYLPLALRIAAAHVAIGTYGSIRDLTDELARGDRLAALECDDDPQLAVRAAFDLSYQHLAEPVRRAFRRLGLIDGPDFTPSMLAVLLGSSLEEARRLLRTLSHAHLVEPKPYGRFRLHDLLREYAREQVRAEESGADCDAAVRDLVGWYVANAELHSRSLDPHRPRVADAPAADDRSAGIRAAGAQSAGAPASPPAEADDRAGYAAALTWFEAERPGLIAAAHQAVRLGPAPQVWRLADAAYDFLRLRRSYQDDLQLQNLALKAARAEGDARAEAFALWHLSEIHRDLGRYSRAVGLANLALSAARLAGTGTAHVLHMHRQLGDLYVATGNYTRAFACLREDLRICRDIDDKSGEAETLISMAFAHRAMGGYAAALECLRQAADIERRMGSRRGEGVALHQLAHTHWAVGSNKKARDHARRAIEARRDVGDQAGEALTLNLLTLISLSLGEHENGVRYAEQALALRRTIADRLGEAEAMDMLSLLHRSLGDYRQARRHALQGLALRREIGDRKGESESLETLARALSLSGEHEKSFESELQSLRIKQEIGDRQGEARALDLLSRLAVYVDRLPDALGYAEQSLSIYRTIGNRKGEGSVLHGMARIYRKLGRPAEAVVHAARSLAIRRDIGDRRGEAEALDNLSRTYLRMGEARTALDHARQALAVERRIDDLFGQGWTLDHLAEIELSLGRESQAVRAAERSLRIREQIHDRYGQRRTLDTLSRIHQRHGRSEQALDAACRALEIARDTVSPQPLVRRLEELAVLAEQARGAEAAAPFRQEIAEIAGRLGGTQVTAGGAGDDEQDSGA